MQLRTPAAVDRRRRWFPCAQSESRSRYTAATRMGVSLCPSSAPAKDFLFKRIAWRIQSLAEGGLSERARRRAEELARDADVRTTVPRPRKAGAEPGTTTVTLPAPRGAQTVHDRLPVAGTVLTRLYRGKRVEAKVLAAGFEHDGQVYRSLSAVAKAVTGTHWNGLLLSAWARRRRRPPSERPR
ncbi:MAG TPA: DUF2924 domain-containing protein [Tepidisphaeraceae bacterium]|nr:DUF2924 domain-containing protein [Tepidisphaeraceae bacterium]